MRSDRETNPEHDRRMLYLMHVDWNWIRQRPHFMAEEIGKRMRVDVGYLLAYRRKNLARNWKEDVRCVPLLRLPGPLTELGAMGWLDRKMLGWQLGARLPRSAYDFVWLCSPIFYPAVRGFLGSTRLIYDCMDDQVAIAHGERAKEYVEKCERDLLRAADVVLVSSSPLAAVVRERGCPRTPVLVNNGVSERILSAGVPARQRRSGEPFRLLYFGTIGRWFDFASILALLSRVPGLELRMAGPREVTIPDHPRLKYAGVVAHDGLKGLVADSDVLIMPFVVNDLVRAVDPVKVYEYIAFRRNIVVPAYPEMKKFEPFVVQYEGAESLIEATVRLSEDNALRYSDEDASRFLRENTWSRRAQVALAALERDRV